MTEFFRPYEGWHPYVFISYSHRDTERVLSIIKPLHDGKLRLWYDEGIPAGNDWSGNIDAHMRACGAVLFFRSKTALASPNCFNEIVAAVAGGHPLLIVPLDDAPIDARWTALLSRGTTLDLKNRGDDNEILSGIRSWRILNRSFYRRRGENIRLDFVGLVAALLFFSLTLAALYGILTGKIDPFRKTGEAPATSAPTPTPYVTEAPSPSPTPDVSKHEKEFSVKFNSQLLEKAVRAAIGTPSGNVHKTPIPRQTSDLTEVPTQTSNLAEAPSPSPTPDYNVYLSDLNGVKKLLLCGHMFLKDMSGVQFDADGTCRVGTGAVIEGDVSDLSLISDMPKLERLALIRQPLSDLSPLNGHVVLEELWLSGNDIASIEALNDLPRLHTLHLEYTAVSDLNGISALSALKELWLSGSKVESIEALKDLPALHTLHLEHTAVRDLTGLSALPALSDVTVSIDMLPLTLEPNARYTVRVVR